MEYVDVERQRMHAAIEEVTQITERVGQCELPETDHVRLVSQLSGLYRVIVNRRRNNKSLFTEHMRLALLAAGLAIFRIAPSSKRTSKELITTSALVIATLYGEYATKNALRTSSKKTTDHWLDNSWKYLFERESDECSPHSFGITLASCSNTREALPPIAYAFWSTASILFRKAIFSPIQPRVLVEEQELETILADPSAISIVSAADAELGQQVFRDLILSFSMPRKSVRCRRTLLFDRDTSRIAETEHSNLLNRAHNAAMQMPSHVWSHGVIEQVAQQVVSSDYLEPHDTSNNARQQTTNTTPDTVHQENYYLERTCALLAGIAMLVADNVEQARTGDAFERLVELPFIQTYHPATDAMRLVLLGSEWYLYETGQRQSNPKILIRGASLQGLVACATKLLSNRTKLASPTSDQS